MSRDALREEGEDIAARLGLDAPTSLVPCLDDLMTEVVHGGVWRRPNLDLADRAICTLAVLSVLKRLAPLKAIVGQKFHSGGLYQTPRTLTSTGPRLEMPYNWHASSKICRVHHGQGWHG
jgi:hypothetical protein